MTKISQGNLKQLGIIFFNYYYFFWLEMLGAYLTNWQCQRHTCKKTLVMSCHTRAVHILEYSCNIGLDMPNIDKIVQLLP